MSKHRENEYKAMPVFVTKVDESQGVVEAVVSVFGVIDGGDDLIESGAFLKTITERTRKIRVLNHHNSWDVRDVLGIPLALREVGRNELPPEILERFPEATGGLWTQTQYLLETPEGKGAFERIRLGAIDEYSIGFQVMQAEYKRVPDASGKSHDIRVIKEIKLWEYSPVIWGMNPATATIGAKQRGGVVNLSLPAWIGGEHPEIVIAKTGRVLSDSNAKKIRDAWKSLGDVLVAAGIALQEDIDSADTVESDSKTKRVEPEQPLTPPADEPSADTRKAERDALLKRIASITTEVL